ncbi:MAG: hypothetical protein IJ228_09840 [Succinivibrio sp.]|nr:hypothetical protein [Succinivibrio sp.]
MVAQSSRLNGGSLKNYTPIGKDGIPVWKNAEAFRNAVRNAPRLGERYAAMLAEPSFNDAGDYVDWYVRVDADQAGGRFNIVRWDAASAQEKEQALAELTDFENRLDDFGQDLQRRALTADDLIFAHYLTGTEEHSDEKLPAVHFPHTNCLFLVNGHPVITFWGFIGQGQKLTGSPFDCLRDLKVRPGAGAAPAAGAGTAAAATAGGHKWCWLWLLLLLLLLPLLMYLLWWYIFARPLNLPAFGAFPKLGELSLEPAVTTELNVPESAVPKLPEALVDPVQVPDKDLTVRDGTVLVRDGALNVDGTLPAVNATASDGTQPEQAVADPDAAAAVPQGAAEQDEGSTALPADEPVAAGEDAQDAQDKSSAQDEQNAQDTQDPDPGKSDAAGADEQTQESSAPLPPDLDAAQNSAAVKPLELDNQTLQKGDLSVLDGQWRSRSGLIDATTGKPVNIDYSFKNGQGQATVTRSDGSKCVGATQGSIASGALQIGSGQAKCPDGSTYDMPKVVCAPDKDGKTSCKGDYGDAKSSFNINLFK